METVPEQEARGLRAKVRERAGNLTRQIFDKIHPKIPVEEIGAQTVAATIDKYLGNPVRERLRGDRWANPFSVVDVLVYLGYVGIWNDTDYAKRFPQSYQKTRAALWQLVQEGVLETLALEKPDINYETIYYKVANEELLRDSAQKKIETKSA